MHVLFCHSQFPAQFGFFADYAVRKLGWRCTFVCETAASFDHRVEIITYSRSFGATSRHSYYSRGFENAAAQYEAVYRALKRHDLKPDLIVSHAGLGGGLFLRELYDAKIINYFEFYYHLRGSDMDFRPEFPPSEDARLRLILRNAPLLLELENCDAGYCPTEFQRQLFPAAHQSKLFTVFDGIDSQIWRPRLDADRAFGKRTIEPRTRIVSYCSRGFESLRGFDMFVKAAKIIYQKYPDVVFVIAGTDRICYGGDQHFIGKSSFKEHVFAQDDYDSSKFLFVGQLAMGALAKMFTVADAHIYLTAPFVLSWSMLNALSCGALVVGSNTAPVREVIEHGVNGLLADFFDPEQIAERTLQVLRDPRAYDPLRQRGRELIESQYSSEVTYPKLVSLYESVASSSSLSVPETAVACSGD